MTDYSRYELDRSRRWLVRLAGGVAGYVAAWLLLLHPTAALVGLLLGAAAPRMYAESARNRRLARLRMQFKEMLIALTSLLSAGRSVESAFQSLEPELLPLLGDERSDLLRELAIISNRLRNGEPLEAALHDLARRSHLEEVSNFADAVSIGKRSGGDLVEIVRQTASILGEKLEVELEVTVIMSRKKFEARLMMGMPFAFVGGIGAIAPDYMRPLHEGAGWLLLAACASALGGCIWWIGRMIDIKV